MRTSLQKLQPTGVVEPERRGGRRQNRIERDKKQKDDIKAHINKFDRIESHYCMYDLIQAGRIYRRISTYQKCIDCFVMTTKEQRYPVRQTTDLYLLR